MKETVRYQFALIPGKLRAEIKLTIDLQRPSEYYTNGDDQKGLSMNFLPLVTLTIARPTVTDENGNKVKPPYNNNDQLGMTKYNFPLFMRQATAFQEKMKTPDLYTYIGERLELNEKKAEEVRDVFPIGNSMVELSAVIITRDTEKNSRIEGIKIKFNNEQSTVVLTINEYDSLIYNLEHVDIDNLALNLYLNFITRPARSRQKNFNENTLKPLVDIVPKDDDDFD